MAHATAKSNVDMRYERRRVVDDELFFANEFSLFIQFRAYVRIQNTRDFMAKI